MSGADAIAHRPKCERSSVAFASRPTSSMSGYAQHPGRETGADHDAKRTVLSRLRYHVPRPLLESPDVLYQLNCGTRGQEHRVSTVARQLPMVRAAASVQGTSRR